MAVTVAVSGVETQIEYPDRLWGEPRRAGWGTVCRQRKGTWNWFHLPVTAPVHEDNEQVHLTNVAFEADLLGAQIEAIHIHDGGPTRWELDDASRLPMASALVRESLPRRGTRFDVPGVSPIIGFLGIVLCLNVSFEGPDRPADVSEDVGQAILRGARFSFSPYS